MAKIFFDTNIFVYLYTKNSNFPISLTELEKHDLFVSALTYHIMAYVQKTKIPNGTLQNSLEQFNVSSLDEKILKLALAGPTNDLEDNIQLHSAAEKDCDYFLTNDKKLLKMKFFGKAKISTSF